MSDIIVSPRKPRLGVPREFPLKRARAAKEALTIALPRCKVCLTAVDGGFGVRIYCPLGEPMAFATVSEAEMDRLAGVLEGVPIKVSDKPKSKRYVHEDPPIE